MSENKRFQLVAWTEGQNVKMIPSVKEFSEGLILDTRNPLFGISGGYNLRY